MYIATVRHNAPTARLDMEELLTECRNLSSQLFEQVELKYDDTTLTIRASGTRRPDLVAFDVLSGKVSPITHIGSVLTQCAMTHDIPLSFVTTESVEVGEQQYDTMAEFIIKGRDLTESCVKNIQISEHGQVVYAAQDTGLSDMRAMLMMGRDILTAFRAPQSYLDAIDETLNAQYAPEVTH